MKVVFLYPSFREKIRILDRVEFPPLGMLSVCAVLEDLGHELSVFPLNMETDASLLPEGDIYAYGITATATYPIFLSKVPELKGKAQIHIAGNTHANIFPEDVFKELGLDAVFTGEAENSIRSWFNKGLRQRGVIRQCCEVDINEIPFPSRHLLPKEKIYLNHRVGGMYHNVISLSSLRGCVNRCSFCAVQSRRSIRTKTPQRFRSELQHILSNYNLCQGLVLLDSNFTQIGEHAINISRVIRHFGLPWECNSRVDTLTEQIISELVRNNCREIKLGIETGSEKLIEKMQKNIDLSEAKMTVKTAFKHGLPVKLNIMHGFPGEDMNTTRQTIDYLSELRPYVNRIGLYRFAPMPGSEIYSSPGIRKLDWSQYTLYDNRNHWFGGDEDFREIEQSFRILKEFVNDNF